MNVWGFFYALRQSRVTFFVAGLLIAAVVFLGYLFFPDVGSKPTPVAPTGPNVQFSDFFTDVGDTPDATLEKLYWFGPKLGPYRAFVRIQEQNAVERAVAAYGPGPTAEAPVVIVRTLDTTIVIPDPEGEDRVLQEGGGWDLLQSVKGKPSSAVPAGRAVKVAINEIVIIAEDGKVVVDISTNQEPGSGDVPTLEELAEQVAPYQG